MDYSIQQNFSNVLDYGYSLCIVPGFQFIDSISLSGFLMDLLGLRLGLLCCMSLTGSGIVFRLHLESECLGFMNFLFLQYIPPTVVCTLYVLLVIISIIVAFAQFLAPGTS